MDENVNKTNETTKVETTIVEATKVEESAKVEVLDKSKTYEEIAELLTKQNPLNLTTTNIVNSFHAEKLATKDGKSFYVNLWLQLEKAVPKFIEKDNGEVIKTLGRVIQKPMFNVTSQMTSRFYTNIISRITSDFSLDAEMNPDPKNTENIYLTDDYLVGIPVKLFGQFVDGGEVATNPFSNNAEPYEVKKAPRYIWHILAVGKPIEEEYLQIIEEIKREVREERRKAKANFLAERAKANLVLQSIETKAEEIPF